LANKGSIPAASTTASESKSVSIGPRKRFELRHYDGVLLATAKLKQAIQFHEFPAQTTALYFHNDSILLHPGARSTRTVACIALQFFLLKNFCSNPAMAPSASLSERFDQTL
jgi:hypothetical protein